VLVLYFCYFFLLFFVLVVMQKVSWKYDAHRGYERHGGKDKPIEALKVYRRLDFLMEVLK
jgi:hypothetical protein